MCLCFTTTHLGRGTFFPPAMSCESSCCPLARHVVIGCPATSDATDILKYKIFSASARKCCLVKALNMAYAVSGSLKENNKYITVNK